jgi:hypothetical protein
VRLGHEVTLFAHRMHSLRRTPYEPNPLARVDWLEAREVARSSEAKAPRSVYHSATPGIDVHGAFIGYPIN